MKKVTEHVPMSDGVRLATDVYLPDEEGPFAVLLMMTPYGKENLEVFSEFASATSCVVVIADVRGRYNSEGEYDPINQERRDAPAMVDWIVRQRWYDAHRGIGVVGISYLSAVGLICAAERPEHVRVLLNIAGFYDTYELTHRGGAVVLHHLLPWSISTAFSPKPDLGSVNWEWAYRTLPLKDAAAEAGHDNRLWRSWISHPLKDAVWENMNLENILTKIDVPILHMSGWYDFCLGSTLDMYHYFKSASECPQYLVVGPWSHNGVFFGPDELAGVNFGDQCRPDVIASTIAWFNRWLDGENPGEVGVLPSNETPVNVFVTGENEWISFKDWPPNGANQQKMFVNDARLSFEPAGECGQRHYICDPENPLPTRGGAIWEFPVADLNPGPADQSHLHERDDVLLFKSDPLEEDMILLGDVSCILYASTDAETSDFSAKLVDISPDGEARIICDGIVRNHLANNVRRCQTVEPETVRAYDIDMWGAAHRMKAGHRIGLEFSGSNFPKWDRNLNTFAGQPQIARHTVCWGENYPTHLKFYSYKPKD